MFLFINKYQKIIQLINEFNLSNKLNNVKYKLDLKSY